MAIVKRIEKGAPLTWPELDNNFIELEEAVETIKNPGEIDFSAVIPFTLREAFSSVFVDQDYTLSLGEDPKPNTFQTIITTGNGVNTISFPSAWKNGNNGEFKPTYIQEINLRYNGVFVSYTITDGPLAPVIDTTKPTVTIASSQSGTTSANPIPLTFTLNEASTDFDETKVIVGANGTLSNFAGSGVNYTADLVPIAEGPITVNILADSFTDEAGNGNVAATEFSVTYQEVIVAEWTDFNGTSNLIKFGDVLDSTFMADSFEMEVEIRNFTPGILNRFFYKTGASNTQIQSYIVADGSFQLRTLSLDGTDMRGAMWPAGTFSATNFPANVGKKVTLGYDATIDTNNGLDRFSLLIDDVLMGGKTIVANGGTLPVIGDGNAQFAFGSDVAADGSISGTGLFDGEAKNLIVRDSSGVVLNVPTLSDGTDISGNNLNGTWV